MARFPLFRRVLPGPVTLYSKADCPLCREAEAVVRRVFGAGRVVVVDIIGDRELEDLYIFRIPVLAYKGEVLAEGRITMADAREARDNLLRRRRAGAGN